MIRILILNGEGTRGRNFPRAVESMAGPYEPEGAIEKAFNVFNLTPKGQEWYNIVSIDGDLY